MAEPTDTLQNLLAAVARGDQLALARVYERTCAHLLGVGERILGRRQAAEDVLQETFVSVWKNASSYDPKVSQPMTWLISITRNRALDVLRAEGRKNEVALDPGSDDEDAPTGLAATLSSGESALDLFSQATQALHIRECMDGLEAAARQGLALAYYQGLSHSEVAAHMGSPLGSVKTWIRRGLAQLKTCLEGRGV
jgi:RNA polymerase sigma-70 factor (ECF subfamily)